MKHKIIISIVFLLVLNLVSADLNIYEEFISQENIHAITNIYALNESRVEVYINDAEVGDTEVIIDYIAQNEQHWSSSGPSKQSFFNDLTEIFEVANEDLSEVHNPTLERYQVNFYNELTEFVTKYVIDPLYDWILYLDMRNEEQDNAIINIDKRLDAIEEYLVNTTDRLKEENINKDSICWGKVRYAYEHNLTHVDCDGFKFDMRIYNEAEDEVVGIKVVPVLNDTPEEEPEPEKDYQEVDQTVRLAWFEEQCEWYKEEDHKVHLASESCHIDCDRDNPFATIELCKSVCDRKYKTDRYTKDVKKYCEDECSGRSNNCVCRNGKIKVVDWIGMGDNVKAAEYSCIDITPEPEVPSGGGGGVPEEVTDEEPTT